MAIVWRNKSWNNGKTMGLKMNGIMAKNGRHVSEKIVPNKGEQ